MTDGRLLLGIATLLCAASFANGVRLVRMAENPLPKKLLFGMPMQGSDMPVDKMRRLGLVFMVVAPLAWLFFVALCFGLFGPVQNIRIIGGAS